MPSGKVHVLTSAFLTVGTTTVAVVSRSLYTCPQTTFGTIELVGFLAGCIFATIVNPDMDVDNRILVYRIPVLGFILKVLFFPYAKLVSHRSIISHFPIVGTLIRVGYTYAVTFIVAFVALYVYGTVYNDAHVIYYPVYLWGAVFNSAKSNLSVTLAFLLGAVIVDAQHFFLDKFVKFT